MQLLSLSSGPNILLDKPILLLGRHPECDIQIDSRKISRRHCCIAQIGEHLVVRDLGSMNGIRIDGERVVEGRLKEGAELTIGNNRYRVTWEAAAELETPGLRNLNAKHGAPRLDIAEDDMLESCDDPVPLPEPPVPGRAKPPVPVARPLSPFASDLPPVLPSEMRLAPGSDIMHGVDSHPPM